MGREGEGEGERGKERENGERGREKVSFKLKSRLFQSVTSFVHFQVKVFSISFTEMG